MLAGHGVVGLLKGGEQAWQGFGSNAHPGVLDLETQQRAIGGGLDTPIRRVTLPDSVNFTALAA
jgi:hypothetical protein